jgi:site-specific DNA recombinase
VAIYARVSSDRQAEAGTIESQVAELKERVKTDGWTLLEEGCFIDEGCSGTTLLRPALERLRDLVANGGVDVVYVHSPDRLARKYAYQVLLIEEFQSAGVEVLFINRPVSQTPEDELLLQVQGMVAEYERAKIMERSRRGKRHAATQGRINVLTGAPYGYRYIRQHEGDGEARYEVLPEEAEVVRQVFEWVGKERCSLNEARKRLTAKGIRTRTGKREWNRSTVFKMLKNPAYKGKAAFGKRRSGIRQARLRPLRGCPEHPRRNYSTHDVCPEEWIEIPVPAIVEETLFEAVSEQLEENRKRYRGSARGASYLLQGLVVCKRCGYSFCGKTTSWKRVKRPDRAYYRCVGRDSYRFGGERICDNPQVRTDMLDAAVWEDVRALLSDPQRIEKEYRRRLNRAQGGGGLDKSAQVEKQIQKVQQGIARLLDIYTDGLLKKDEFEPRLAALRERLEKLQCEREAVSEQETEQKDLELVVGRIQEFADRVNNGLQETDWTKRRDIVRALVKKVEIDEDQVKVVYRISPVPFEQRPQGGFSQDCLRRAFSGTSTLTSGLYRIESR